MESFFGTLKTECVDRQNYKTRQEAKTAIFEYMEVFTTGKGYILRRLGFTGAFRIDLAFSHSTKVVQAQFKLSPRAFNLVNKW
jgi:hypothetical protein